MAHPEGLDPEVFAQLPLDLAELSRRRVGKPDGAS